MLGPFRAVERATGDDTWDAVDSACNDVVAHIQENYSPETGLLPDFVMTASKDDHTPRPADRDFLDGPTDGSYSYNAGRVPWRLGVDALLNGDEVTVEQLRTISTWIEASTNGQAH